jgi:hypothetical protein
MVASILSFTRTNVSAASVVMARPDGVEEGDLLLFVLEIGGVAAEAATMTFPSVAWREHLAASPLTGVGQRQLQAFKYATDDEDSTYTFTYTASRPMVGTLIAIRGAKRDYEYNPVSYPYGYFAPGNPTLGSSNVAATTTISPFPLITSVEDNTLGIYFFTQYDSAGGAILLDDPSPLVEIIHRTVYTASGRTLAVLAMEVLYETPQTAPAITAMSSASARWLALAVAVESAEGEASEDNYKSKLLRHSLPPPYDTRFSSNLGKLLTVIGTSDNEIGGLYGDADFLPDEEI